MANTTDTFFSVDGESLQTYAYNITSWGGSREAPPGMRGGNIVIPGRAGQIFTPKVVDARTITLSMWVTGATPDGGVPTSGTAKAQFEYNFKNLRRLLYTAGREVTLTKRFRNWGSDNIIPATGKAQFAGGLTPTMQGPSRGLFTVDLLMADPFFYGETIASEIVQYTSQTFSMTVPGDYRTTDVTMEISGARSDVKATVTNSAGELWAKYTNPLGSGDKATVVSKDYSSRTTPNGAASYGSSGFVTHGGDVSWLALEPGVNRIKIESASGTGNVQFKYKPVWF